LLLAVAAVPPVVAPARARAATAAVPNTLTIVEKAGVTTAGYPIQIGRPFREGEIREAPQAVLDGTPVATQADVKTRWRDGSVQHAVVSFVAPTLRAKKSITVGFRDQPAAAGDGTLPPRLDATLSVNGTRVSADAMIAAGAYTYWLRGPIVTSIVVADHAGKAFDVGSVRPLFHVTHWPGLGRTRVRFVGEIADTEKMQDVKYELALSTGEKATIVHQAGARWTRETWIGGVPPAIAIDHNLAYLASTRLVPNYDTTLKVSAAGLAEATQQWTRAAKGFFEPGNWTTAMGAAGGRSDIGPMPTWTIRCLYSGDPGTCAQAFGNADLAAAWPVHFREGRTDKFLDRERTVPGLGHVLSISTRPTLHLLRPFATGSGSDRIVAVGPTDLTTNAWRPDLAHQPDPTSMQYLISGDFWYLEELWFWASYGAGYPAGGPGTSGCSRGPTGAEGGFPGFTSGCATIRSQAWGLRTRAQAAAFSPDGTPEKGYFTRLMEDALCIWEGSRGIAETDCAGKPTYEWGRTVDARTIWHGAPPAPLHQWEVGGQALEPLNPAKAGSAYAPWQQSFLMSSLGRAAELGFPAQRLLAWLAPNTVGLLTDPAMDPHYIASPLLPVWSAERTYLRTWPEVRAAYLPTFDPVSDFKARLGNADHGYSIVAMPAVAAIAGEPGGAAAWAWIRRHVREAAEQALSFNPKWAILPRG